MARNTFSIILILTILLFSAPSLAATEEVQAIKQYDGIWFLGFNMHKDIFSGENGALVRRAFNLAVDRDWIVKNIVGDNVTPTSAIPPGMSGYDPDFIGFSQDIPAAKELMRQAGYPTSDERLKELSLLHTNGEMTIEIAKWVKRYLIKLGVDLKLVEVNYSDSEKWEQELSSGKHHMFFMGYKASLFEQILVGDREKRTFHTIECDRLPSAEAQEFFGSFGEAIGLGYGPGSFCRPKKGEIIDAYALLDPLFHSEGEANFTFYSNPRVDALLNQVNQLDPLLRLARAAKLKQIEKLLLEDPPTINIFYITKL
jgi:ABC-type transport system substrate-binding protein